MPGIDFREARARVRLLEVLDLPGFAPRSRWGSQLRGPCPVHRSRTRTSRAFAAHLDRDVWHCFACRASGNALDLWVAVTHQDIHAAVVDLVLRLGRDVPWLPMRAGRGCRSAAQGEQVMPEP
jgi:DNA primase